MDKENQLLLERITINPDVMVGKPTIRGLRITVGQILKALSGGLTQNDLLEDYPNQNRKIFRLHCYTPLNGSERNAFLRLTQGSDYERKPAKISCRCRSWY